VLKLTFANDTSII